MDKNELERRERWAELAASIAQADRNIEAKARRHRTLRFWFSPWQVADEPVAADVTPGEPRNERPRSTQALGVTSGEADSEPTTAVSHTPAVRRFVGPAGPTSTDRPQGGTGPATPHPLAAVRISGAHTWH